jgi:hypothetical protein
MRLFERSNSGWPSQAGMAIIRYSKEAKLPTREREMILLPNDPELEYFPLKQGSQFLVRCPEVTSTQPTIFFGGTDELPFLVPLKEEPFRAFIERGYHGFYQSLKPPVHRRWAGSKQHPTRRQGDMFVTDLKLSWRELDRIIRLVSGEELSLDYMQDSSVGGTRHTVKRATP